MATLAAGYGAGAAKIHQAISEAGFDISEHDAGNLHRGFWQLFKGVKSFAAASAEAAKTRGLRVYNRFGQSAVVSSPHKAFNWMVQSSINPIIQYFSRELLAACPSAQFVTWIHDELIVELPAEHVETLKSAHAAASTAVNDWLQFETLKMRFGLTVGGDLYDIK